MSYILYFKMHWLYFKVKRFFDHRADVLVLRRPPSKEEKILKGKLDSIPTPSPSVKIQIMAGKLA